MFPCQSVHTNRTSPTSRHLDSQTAALSCSSSQVKYRTSAASSLMWFARKPSIFVAFLITLRSAIVDRHACFIVNQYFPPQAGAALNTSARIYDAVGPLPSCHGPACPSLPFGMTSDITFPRDYHVAKEEGIELDVGATQVVHLCYHGPHGYHHRCGFYFSTRIPDELARAWSHLR